MTPWYYILIRNRNHLSHVHHHISVDAYFAFSDIFHNHHGIPVNGQTDFAGQQRTASHHGPVRAERRPAADTLVTAEHVQNGGELKQNTITYIQGPLGPLSVLLQGAKWCKLHGEARSIWDRFTSVCMSVSFDYDSDADVDMVSYCEYNV